MSLRIGMGEPYAIRVTVPSSADFDPTTPTGGTLELTKPDGERITRPLSISSQTSLSISALYSLAIPDLDIPGVWRMWIQWTVGIEAPGPRTSVTSFTVIGDDQL